MSWPGSVQRHRQVFVTFLLVLNVTGHYLTRLAIGADCGVCSKVIPISQVERIKKIYLDRLRQLKTMTALHTRDTVIRGRRWVAGHVAQAYGRMRISSKWIRPRR